MMRKGKPGPRRKAPKNRDHLKNPQPVDADEREAMKAERSRRYHNKRKDKRYDE